MKNGEAVRRFEEAFAEYVGARYAIALCNGTATLHTALVALGVKPGDRVAVPPLTMASTTIAVLHAGAVPEFVDVSGASDLYEPNTWVVPRHNHCQYRGRHDDHGRFIKWFLTVDLYGLWRPNGWDSASVVDGAQTLRQHGRQALTSYSFQASKILPLGEGGMLVTNNEDLARRAREFSSLGYRMEAEQPRIDPAAIKRPDAVRHHAMGWNYRMSDATAKMAMGPLTYEMPTMGLPGSNEPIFRQWDALKEQRQDAAVYYRQAIAGCPWIIPQHVPEGWRHDMWTYAVALESAELWEPFTQAIVENGGEMPYGAWRLTYQEPAFRHLAEDGCCPVAEDLQPRLVQFQTNDLESAARNAEAVSKAIEEING